MLVINTFCCDVASMKAAINIRCDNPTADPIYKIWEAMSTFEESPSMLSLEYPPHFTFAIYEEFDLEVLKSTAREISQNCPPITVTFSEISLFDVERLVLWLRATDETPLTAIHSQIHRLVDPSSCIDYYTPQLWQPHCTIGMNFKIEMRDAALEFASRPFKPFEVKFDVLDCVTFLPVTVQREVRLG